jgi:hypothetical protein
MAAEASLRLHDEDLREMVSRAALERQTSEFSPLLTIDEVVRRPTYWVGDAPKLGMRAVATRWARGTHVDPLHALFGHVHAPAFFSTLRELMMPEVEGGPGFVMAGGSVSVVARASEVLASQDVDFFPVGLTAEQARMKIDRLINLVTSVTDPEQYNEEDNTLRAELWPDMERARVLLREAVMTLAEDGSYRVHVYRTPNAVTIDITVLIRLQFITRLYPTREAVVRDFDIAPCQMLYDGFDLFMTELAAFSSWTGLFPPELDHCVCPATYARRASKYLSRGWKMLLLDLTDEVLKEESYYLPGLGAQLRVERVGGRAVCRVEERRMGEDEASEAAQEGEYEIGGAAREEYELVMEGESFDGTWALALDGESLKSMWGTSAFELPPGEPNDLVKTLAVVYEDRGRGKRPTCVQALYRDPDELQATGVELSPYLYRALHYDPLTCAVANLRALLKDDPWRVYYWDSEAGVWRVCCDAIHQGHIEELEGPDVNSSCRLMYQRWLSLGSPSIQMLKDRLRASPPLPDYEERAPLGRETIPEHVWYGSAYSGTSLNKYAGFRS